MAIKDKRDSLFEIVGSQHGIFTTKQAVDAGYDRNTHPYQVKKSYWIRESRGIYRQANYHFDPESEYVIWSLWSRNRLEQPQGVYSHDTALSMFDLSDLNPSKLHMTVPPTFRKNCGTPDHLITLRSGQPSKTVFPFWLSVDCGLVVHLAVLPRSPFTSGDVACRAVSPDNRRLPASRNSLDQP